MKATFKVSVFHWALRAVLKYAIVQLQCQPCHQIPHPNSASPLKNDRILGWNMGGAKRTPTIETRMDGPIINIEYNAVNKQFFGLVLVSLKVPAD